MNTHGGHRPGAGRKPVVEVGHLATARISVDHWNAIPGNKAEFIRQAVKEKLEKEVRINE